MKETIMSDAYGLMKSVVPMLPLAFISMFIIYSANKIPNKSEVEMQNNYAAPSNIEILCEDRDKIKGYETYLMFEGAEYKLMKDSTGLVLKK